MKNIVNIDSVEWQVDDERDDFNYSRKHLTQLAGGEMLGASLYKVMPGKKAFPYHLHYGNEEAILVLEGCGTLRLNNEVLPIKKGDYIALPKGPDHAHQILNDSSQPLVYFCFSTMVHPDVLFYPDSEKVGLSAGVAPGGDKNKSHLKKYFKKQSAVSYFEGE